MQDHARCHTSKSSLEFLKKEHQIPCLTWMDKGADLNPIEEVWSGMKNFVYEKRHLIKNKKDVWKFSKIYWYSEDCRELIKNSISQVYERV